MSTVEEWAKREAEKRWPVRLPYNALFERWVAKREGYRDGANHLAALLLSDEAREAVAIELASHVDLIDWDSERRDTGGIQCSCRKWKAGPGADGVRPRAGWQLHLSKAVLLAALTKITEDKE